MTNAETLTRLSNIRYMVECGIHSGFPACCVQFYVTRFAWMKSAKRQSYSDKVGDCWGYIPCLECFKKGNVVKVLPCPADSHCFYVNESLEGVPSPQTKETDRPIAYQLRGGIDEVARGLQAIRGGNVPSNGSYVAAMTRSLHDITKIIERAT